MALEIDCRELPNRVNTSFTSVGNCRGSRGLCRTLEDRHDLHHTPLGLIPEPMRNPLGRRPRNEMGR